MKKNGVRGKDLAKHLNISDSAVSTIVMGKRTPSLINAMMIQEFTKGEVKWYEMFADKDKKNYEKYLRNKDK